MAASDSTDGAGHRLSAKRADQFREQASALFFLSDAYLNAPRVEVVAALCSQNLLDHWPFDRNGSDAVAGGERLKRYLAAWSPDDLAALEDDYTRLFIGIGETLAPPYESVYLSEEHIIFEKETLAVRKWYGKYGLQVPHLHVQPDDHIGYELFFLARLSERVASLLDSGKTEAATTVIRDRRHFVDTHPYRWVHMFVGRILEFSETDYYGGIGQLTKSVVEQGRAPG